MFERARDGLRMTTERGDMATTTQPSQTALDAYRVQLLVGDEKMAGAPLLRLALLVEAQISPTEAFRSDTARACGRCTPADPG